MNTSDQIKERIKSVMITDRSRNAENVLRVLKSDLYSLISDYFDVSPENIKLELTQCEGGGYVLNFQAFVERILDSGNIIE